MLDIKALQKAEWKCPDFILPQIDSDTYILLNKSDSFHVFKPVPPGKMKFTNRPLRPSQYDGSRPQRGLIPIIRTKRGKTIAYGQWGLRVLQPTRFTQKQLESAQTTIRRCIKGVKGARLWLRLYPNQAMTKKPAEVRMGKGKGRFDHYAARCAKDRILFELGGDLRPELVKECMRLATSKLPCRTKLVKAPLQGETIAKGKAKFLAELKNHSKKPAGCTVVSLKNVDGVVGVMQNLTSLLAER